MGKKGMTTLNDLLSHEELKKTFQPPLIFFGSQTMLTDIFTEVTHHPHITCNAGIDLSVNALRVPSFGALVGTEVYGRKIVRYLVVSLGSPAETGEPTQLSPLHWAARLRSELIAFGQMRDNWDSDGARAATPETLSDANRTLEALISFAIKARLSTYPSLTLLPDGAVRFEWINQDRELFLTILNGTIEAQRWKPLSALDSEYFEEIQFEQLQGEVSWLSA